MIKENTPVVETTPERVGILNLIPEAPTKPLVQEVLRMYPNARLVGLTVDVMSDPDTLNRHLAPFERLVHDGHWQFMNHAARNLVRAALENGSTIQPIKGRRGEV